MEPKRPSQRVPAVTVKMGALHYDVMNAARRLLAGSLGLVLGERIVLIGDHERRDLVAVFEYMAMQLGATPVVVLLEDAGERPLASLPARVVEELGRAQASALLCGYDEGELVMRRELTALTDSLGLRHAHMVGLTAKALVPGFAVDPERILDATRAVRMRLRPDSKLTVRSRSGTDLRVQMDPACRWWECSGVVRPGRWENFPSGRLSSCPASVDGVFVADASAAERFGAEAGLLARKPVRLEIEGGVLRTAQSSDDELAAAIDAYLGGDPAGRRVGLVHVGTNVGLVEPVGELICDLNLPGLHVGLGTPHPRKTGATWDVSVQLAMTGSGQDVDLDGSPLVRAGRYLV